MGRAGPCAPPQKKLAVWRLEISKETQGYSFLSGVARQSQSKLWIALTPWKVRKRRGIPFFPASLGNPKQALDCTHSLESNRK